MLVIKNLSITYTQKPIVKNFNLSLETGHILAMLGNSGSGKTSILKAISGLISIDSGTIDLDGKTIHTQPPESRNIGMMFQDYALFPHLTVEKNIGFGLRKFTKSQRNKTIKTLLDLVDLPDLQKYYPHQLSGGQQQRIALVRSLATKPKVLLLDEPFSNLDNKHKLPLIHQMKDILKQEKMTAIFVTHNTEEAQNFADHTLNLH